MNIRLILPTRAVSVEPNARVFFLAGPVSGGGNWQSEATGILERKVTGAYVVSPRDYTIFNPIFHYAIEEDDKGPEPFLNQDTWEEYYLDLACKQGAVVFWLPDEDKIFPCSADSYGRDAYREFSEWLVRMKRKRDRNNVRMAIGAGDKFPGLSVIAENCKGIVGSGFTVHKTLRDTVDVAVALTG